MKTRILSAIVMITIAVPVLVIGGNLFKIFAILLGLCSLYEMFNIRKKEKNLPTIIKIISYILLGIYLYLGTNSYTSNYEIIYKIIIGLILIYFIPVVLYNDNEKYNILDAFYVLTSSIFIGVAFNSSIMVMNKDLSYLLYLLLITVCTDTFAYFTGYFIGKHKLCEKISPKKTIEGAVGGSVVGTIIASLFYLYVINNSINLILLLSVTLFLSIIGQIGDLFFSSIKRYYKVKDFSKLIPGHGGILDRLDSLILVILTYILFTGIL